MSDERRKEHDAHARLAAEREERRDFFGQKLELDPRAEGVAIIREGRQHGHQQARELAVEVEEGRGPERVARDHLERRQVVAHGLVVGLLVHHAHAAEDREHGLDVVDAHRVVGQVQEEPQQLLEHCMGQTRVREKAALAQEAQDLALQAGGGARLHVAAAAAHEADERLERADLLALVQHAHDVREERLEPRRPPDLQARGLRLAVLLPAHCRSIKLNNNYYDAYKA